MATEFGGGIRITLPSGATARILTTPHGAYVYHDGNLTRGDLLLLKSLTSEAELLAYADPPHGSAALKMCRFFGGGECTTRGELVDGLCAKHQAARGPIFDVATTEGMLDYLEALDEAKSDAEVDRLVGRLPVVSTPAPVERTTWEPVRVAAWLLLFVLSTLATAFATMAVAGSLLAGNVVATIFWMFAFALNVLGMRTALRHLPGSDW